jgi:hypothetical protein
MREAPTRALRTIALKHSQRADSALEIVTSTPPSLEFAATCNIVLMFSIIKPNCSPTQRFRHIVSFNRVHGGD